MIRRHPRSTRTAPLFPSTTLVRSAGAAQREQARSTRRKHFQRGAVKVIVDECAHRPGAIGKRRGLFGQPGRQIMKLMASSVSLVGGVRSEEHTSELQSLMRISYAVFCLNKKKKMK